MTRATSVHVHKPMIYVLVTSCLLMLGTVFAESITNAQSNEKRVVPKVGDQAPDFSLNDFKGNKITLSKLTKGKSVLLWFTNFCEGCQSKIADVQKLNSLYGKKGIDVLAVSVLGEDRKTVEEVIQKNKVTFLFLYDPKGDATERYSGTYIEGTCPLKNIFVIERGGKITFASHLPGVDQQELTNQLERTTEAIKK